MKGCESDEFLVILLFTPLGWRAIELRPVSSLHMYQEVTMRRVIACGVSASWIFVGIACHSKSIFRIPLLVDECHLCGTGGLKDVMFR